MKKAFVAIGLLLLCSSAVSASPSPEPASFLNSLNGGGSCSAPIQTAAKKDGPGGGVTTFSYCNEGWVEWRGGGCCQDAYLQWNIYECIGGMWQHVDTFCDSVTCY